MKLARLETIKPQITTLEKIKSLKSRVIFGKQSFNRHCRMLVFQMLSSMHYYLFPQLITALPQIYLDAHSGLHVVDHVECCKGMCSATADKLKCSMPGDYKINLRYVMRIFFYHNHEQQHAIFLSIGCSTADEVTAIAGGPGAGVSGSVGAHIGIATDVGVGIAAGTATGSVVSGLVVGAVTFGVGTAVGVALGASLGPGIGLATSIVIDFTIIAM